MRCRRSRNQENLLGEKLLEEATTNDLKISKATTEHRPRTKANLLRRLDWVTYVSADCLAGYFARRVPPDRLPGVPPADAGRPRVLPPDAELVSI